VFFFVVTKNNPEKWSGRSFVFLIWNGKSRKRKKHLGEEMLFVEVASGFEPLYEVLQTSA
jgi:hypothetical protein